MIIFYSANFYLVSTITRNCENLFYVSKPQLDLWWSHKYGRDRFHLCINHYDFVALHSMWIIFLKGYCVLVRVEIIHKSKFLPGTVEKNSSTIRSSSRNRTHACAMPVHCSENHHDLPSTRSQALPIRQIHINYGEFLMNFSQLFPVRISTCV